MFGNCLVVDFMATFLLSTIFIIDGCQYSEFSPRHTMCAYWTSGCPLMNTGLSKQEIQLIVDEHNVYRQRLANGHQSQGNQPLAADMRQMEWDNELATIAQKWAEQCKTQHDCADCRQVPRFRVGQNIYMFASTANNATTDWPTAVYEWYKEVSIFSPNKIEPFQHPHAAGHYTQLGWSGTYKVGCGYAYFQKGEWFTKLYICDYGPSGNVLGDRMYVKGPACSACPEGTTCSNQYPGLCASGGYSGGGGHNFVAPSPINQKNWQQTQTSVTPYRQSGGWTTPRTGWAKNPRQHTKKLLLSCDFDYKGCSPETMGDTGPWTLRQSDAPQGNYYDVQVPKGKWAHLYVYNTYVNDGDTGSGIPIYGKACLSFVYIKFPLAGQWSVDLEVAVWRNGNKDSVAEYKVSGVAAQWTKSRMTIPAFSDIYSVSFHVTVPNTRDFGDQYVAVDQISLDAGSCW